MGEADGMICGMVGSFQNHLQFVDQVIGKRVGVHDYYAMNLLILPRRTCSSRHVREQSIPRRADHGDDAARVRTRSAASASAPRCAAVALELRHEQRALGRARCAARSS
jgi:hypothetical protein